MRYGICLLIAIFTPLVFHAQSLSVKPTRVQPNQSATLRWNVGPQTAYVMGYGKVAGSGFATITRDSSTEFILTFYDDDANRYKFKTATLTVLGGRGDDEFPSLETFSPPVQGRRERISYVDFQAIVWEALQKKQLKVRGDYAPGRPYVTIYTDFELRPDLVGENRHIRARRLAYAVDVYEPPPRGPITFGVRAKMEFQYTGEKNWRSDKDSPAATAEASGLMDILRARE